MSQNRYDQVIGDEVPQDRLENESSDAIKHRIDRTRNAMDETLDEIGDRLNPHTLLDEAMALFRSRGAKNSAKRASGAVGDFAKNLGRQVRDNPIPTLLVGAGLAWLALTDQDDEEPDYYEPSLSRNRRPGADLGTDFLDHEQEHLIHEFDAGFADDFQTREFMREPSSSETDSESLSSRAKDAVSSVGESVSDAAASLGEKVSHAASAAKDAATGGMSSMSSAAASAGERARDGYRSAQKRLSSTYRKAGKGSQRASRSARAAYRSGIGEISEVYDRTTSRLREAHHDYPLGMGLGFLALGALAGLAVPRTRQEDEWMGESSDHFREEALHAGEEAIERGKDAVAGTVQAAKRSAEEQGLTGENLASRASHVAEKVATSISDAAKEEGLHPQQLQELAKKVAEDTSQKAQQELDAAEKDTKKTAEKVAPDVSKATEGKNTSPLKLR